ncbi:MAG: GNAT family N-acetyltransferase [Gemmatimonadota bacterium]
MDFRPARLPTGAITLAECEVTPAEYLALYEIVGGPWQWRDRFAWSEEQLAAYLASPELHLWILRIGNELAGYFELQRQASDRVEIMYFGLAVPFIGRGLGGWLLTRAVEESFALGATVVSLNTCTLDSPHALPNYRARGFSIVREERYVVDLSP